MAEVYLSYAAVDREKAEKIVQALRASDLDVAWDLDLQVGQSWVSVIADAVERSKCVVVLWSAASVASDRVRAEAHMGVKRGNLVPALIEAIRPPLGFAAYRTVDLAQWEGDRADWSFKSLVAGIRAAKARSEAGSPAPVADEEISFSTLRSPTAEPDEEDLPGAIVRRLRKTPYKRAWGASRTTIFVAHASSDKQRIAPIVATLLKAGFGVWIDKPHLLGLSKRSQPRLRGIEYGGADWREQIRRAVSKSKVVLALWSNDAIDARREQFYYEVYMGLVQRKLFQASLDKLSPEKIGMPFTFDQIADLANFNPHEYHAELDILMSGFPKARRRFL